MRVSTLLCLALSACTTVLARPVSRPTGDLGSDLARAVAIADEAHPTAVAYAIDHVVEHGKRTIAVWMVEGEVVHGVHLDAGGGTVVFDESFPVDERARETVPVLERELRSRVEPLGRGVGWMAERYGRADLRSIELELHGSSLVLEALLGEGATEAVHVHDPDDGRYLMTEVGEPPLADRI